MITKDAVKICFFGLVMLLLLVTCGGAPACTSYGSVPVCNVILHYYRDHGGPELLGYPITALMQQNDYIVQYFEKGVIQYPVSNPRYEAVGLEPL